MEQDFFLYQEKNYPKQFLKIGGDKSLFQKTIERVLYLLKPEDIIITINRDYKFYIQNQLSELFNNSVAETFNIILEPAIKNTAPAIALALKFALEKLNISENEVIFVFPSDHFISPAEKFAEYMKKAEEIAKKGYIVTFGITPTKPETGYGYIEADNTNKVKKFHEKPDFDTAKKYLAKGNYYWNSGMFAFTLDTIFEEFQKYAPEIYERLENKTFEEVLKNFESMPNISIDYAVMEKTDKAMVLPFDLFWSDVGCWESVYEYMEKDKTGNVSTGSVLAVDTKNSLILSNKRVITTIGVEDLIVVETDDVLLIAKKGEGQKVRRIVEMLKEKRDFKHLTEFHTTVYRPWGSYTELERGKDIK